MSAYEKQRLANIERNKKLLKDLGLDKPFFEPVEKIRKPKAKASPKKRTFSQTGTEGDDPGTPAAKKLNREVDSVAEQGASSLRRSTRNQGKAIDYNTEKRSVENIPISMKAGTRKSSNTGPLGREDGRRKYDPKTFGSIPGIDVGTWWETRQGCSTDSIHAPWVGGISGGSNGAYSVALSGGYDDDVDEGYAFTYTGSGGRDLKGTKDNPKNLRTAPQSSDQTFENSFNAALKRSSETRKPVRVIRGFKSTSAYAPTEGYRYDGLYVVEKAWMEKGLNPKGHLVCKYLFKRLPNQPPIPIRRSEDEESTRSGSETEA
ncbi:hypothetical protein D9757_002899 [Collybiopsis confluens]|uniref:YDG domain-containing protein n=1 Tax=Collybiopsis confluens TaxID=2823264 RepID=A0A8H5MDX5_9AGAR|nr:hypothetical protein D9757_002899 [Collybiopsis confluens]